MSVVLPVPATARMAATATRPHTGDEATLPLVRTPRMLRATRWWLPAAFLALAFAAIVVPWQQSAFSTGKVVAWTPGDRQQNIESPITGRVVTWHVREGDAVIAGQRLVSLSDNDPDLLDRLRQERESLLTQQDAAVGRVTALEARLTALRASRSLQFSGAGRRRDAEADRLRAAREQLASDEASLLSAEQNLQRVGPLTAQGLRSERDLELAQAARDSARAAVERARAGVAAADNVVGGLEAERDNVQFRVDGEIAAIDAELQSAIANVAAADQRILQLDSRISKQELQEVTAPRDGMIARIYGGAGTEQVREGDPLITLVPDSASRAVELWFDGNDATLLREGQEVRVQFEGWPALQFVGWPSVAIGTFEGRLAFVDAMADNKGQFRALVVASSDTAWPDPRWLRQGVKAKGWALLNVVPLGFELWRQLNDFPATVDAPDEEKSSDPAKKDKAGKAWNPK